MKIIIQINKDTSIIAETFNSVGVECINQLDELFNELLEMDSDQKKEDFFKSKVKPAQNQNVTKYE